MATLEFDFEDQSLFSVFRILVRRAQEVVPIAFQLSLFHIAIMCLTRLKVLLFVWALISRLFFVYPCAATLVRFVALSRKSRPISLSAALLTGLVRVVALVTFADFTSHSILSLSATAHDGVLSLQLKVCGASFSLNLFPFSFLLSGECCCDVAWDARHGSVVSCVRSCDCLASDRFIHSPTLRSDLSFSSFLPSLGQVNITTVQLQRNYQTTERSNRENGRIGTFWREEQQCSISKTCP